MCKKIQNNTDKPFAKHSLRRKDGRLKKNQFKQQIIKAFEARGIWCVNSPQPAMAFFPLAMILIDRIHTITGTQAKHVFDHATAQARSIARQDGIVYGFNGNGEAMYSFSDVSLSDSST